MQKHTDIVPIAKRRAAKRFEEVKGRLKYNSFPFKPKPTLLLDIAPADGSRGPSTTGAGNR